MKYVLIFIALISIYSCNQLDKKQPNIIIENPAAEGFDLENSDAKAISIADSVMNAMGGRYNWDQTRFLQWNFFGSRKHVWDRKTNNIVIEGIKDTFKIKMNLNNLTGNVKYKGVDLTEQDSLYKYLEKGKSMWINDAYWIIMPFKLKDSGTTLNYIKSDTTSLGRSAHVLSLMFKEVGDTPKNKYHIYVDDSTHLISQWDFYNDRTDTLPTFSTPWQKYKTFGNIKLSSSRGGDYIISEISTSDTLANYFN